MTGIDEQTLSRRLHQELDALPAPAAPVGAVIRRGAARRARCWVATASGLAAAAAVAAAVQLGAAGDCFVGATFDGHAATQATDCVPIAAPPAGAGMLQRFVLQQRTASGNAGLTGYAGLASPRTAYLVARLSDGRSVRVRPAQADGRRYLALALPAGLTVTEVTGYDRAGQPIARW